MSAAVPAGLRRCAILNWPMTSLDPVTCGGVERVALGVREALESLGVRATLTVAGVAGPPPAGVDVVADTRVLRRLTFPLYYLRFWARHGGADVLHAHNAPLLAVLAPRRTLVWLGNEVRLDGYRRFPERYARARYAFDSAFLLRRFRERYAAIPSDRCRLLPNAVDTRRFAPGDPRPAGGPARILFVGQWNRAKGLPILLDAARILAGRGVPFELRVTGSTRLWRGPADEADARDVEGAVAAAARDLPQIRVEGSVPYERLPDLYRQADICAVPSVWDDPAPTVAVQGMASALPVVAFRRGGLPDLVEDGATGILCPEEGAADLAAVLERLCLDAPLRRAMGARAREVAVARYGWDAFLSGLLDLYGRILADAGPAGGPRGG